MSSQNPRSPRPRRRIAGERRPVRPDEGTESAEATDGTTELPQAAPADAAGTQEPPPAPPRTTERLDPARPDAETRSHEPAEPDAQDEHGDHDDEPRVRRAPGWRLVTVLGVLALVLAVVAGVLAFGVWKVGEVREQDAVDEARRTAPASAERAAAAILSYDHESLDADAKSAGRYMTPAYRKQYLSTFDELVRPNATKVKAVVAADVKASAVTQADPDRVSVLLYVNQTTTSTANSGEPQLALNRVQMTMVQRDGRWLVSNITSY